MIFPLHYDSQRCWILICCKEPENRFLLVVVVSGVSGVDCLTAVQHWEARTFVTTSNYIKQKPVLAFGTEQLQ